MRNAFTAILVSHVIDDAIAAIHAKIDVEVRHRNALWIQEALKQQVVLQRVDIGDAECVSHQRAGSRAAPRTHRHAIGARPANEIRDDQKISGESHLTNDGELTGEPRCISGGVRDRCGEQTLRQARFGLVAHKLFDTARIGHREFRQPALAQSQRQIAAARNLDAVRQRFGQILEQLLHLGGAAQVLLRRIFSRPRRVGQQRAIMNTDARLMRFKISRAQKAHFVGGYQRYAAPRCQAHGSMAIVVFACSADAA